jgi:hypothetical protein
MEGHSPKIAYPEGNVVYILIYFLVSIVAISTYFHLRLPRVGPEAFWSLYPLGERVTEGTEKTRSNTATPNKNAQYVFSPVDPASVINVAAAWPVNISTRYPRWVSEAT